MLLLLICDEAKHEVNPILTEKDNNRQIRLVVLAIQELISQGLIAEYQEIVSGNFF